MIYLLLAGLAYGQQAIDLNNYPEPEYALQYDYKLHDGLTYALGGGSGHLMAQNYAASATFLTTQATLIGIGVVVYTKEQSVQNHRLWFSCLITAYVLNRGIEVIALRVLRKSDAPRVSDTSIPEMDRYLLY